MLKLNFSKPLIKITFFFLLNMNLFLLVPLGNLLTGCNTTEPIDNSGVGTTSHNFTWQKFTFGGAETSSLFDVAIIDENNIWAVGEIYMNDSLGNPDPNPYNAIHWNGLSWELKMIKTNACGGVDYLPIKAIFAFSSDDILFAHIDGSISYFNGIDFTNDCSLIIQLNGSVNKIWGISKNNFYVVSDNGFIAHYQSGSWTKIESGSTLTINDVWGNVENNITTVLAAASNQGTTDQKKLIRIQGSKIDTLNWSPQRTLYTVWFNNLNTIYAGGDGLYFKTQNSWETNNALQTYFSFRVRGTATNNVITAGGFGFAAHFNGANWKVLDDVALVSGNYYGLDFKGNITALVGSNGSSAIITIGRRQ